jgi:protein-L-isoaspartate(D-aspartate) O-methyltransferase
MTKLEDARRAYATEIKATANIRSHALIEAFAQVPREQFLGPGPWKVVFADPEKAGALNYRTTETADPEEIYHNVLVAIDSERQLNNGQPTAIAVWADCLDLKPGIRVFHLGCGTGYYTAIIAHVVGAAGKVKAVEVDPALAGLAIDNLRGYSNVEALHADGADFDPGETDAMLINAGVSFVKRKWLERLTVGGTMVVPYTMTANPPSPPSAPGMGYMFKITRTLGDKYPARAISSVGIFPCTSARDAEADVALRKLLSTKPITAITCVRVDEHQASETCAVHTAESCLSCEPLG